MTGKTKYTKLIAAINGYDIQRWLIPDGMGFQASSKWWAQGARNLPHNGIDLRAYEDSAGRISELDAETIVPAVADGKVVAVIRDFLGQSVFVEHEAHDGKRLISAYGHIVPNAQCVTVRDVKSGQAIATLAVSTAVPPHLHLSLILLPAELDPSALTWQALDANAGVSFLDPALWL